MPERPPKGTGEAVGAERPGPEVCLRIGSQACPAADGGLGDFFRLRAEMELGRN